jgi:hypothetical protein
MRLSSTKAARAAGYLDAVLGDVADRPRPCTEFPVTVAWTSPFTRMPVFW